VCLGHDIGDRQLQLVDEEAARNVLRCEAVLLAEVNQDIGGLRDL
jgi:hypothetical protein